MNKTRKINKYGLGFMAIKSKDVVEIRKFDDPILTKKCTMVDMSDLGWIKQLQATCLNNRNCAGLAAPQIGLPLRGIFLRYNSESGLVMLNPTIWKLSDNSEEKTEGCMSYPDVFVNVSRYTRIGAVWISPEGKQFCREFSGFEARLLQHEFDHIEGVCLVGDEWRRQRGEFIGSQSYLGGKPLDLGPNNWDCIIDKEMLFKALDLPVDAPTTGFQTSADLSPEENQKIRDMIPDWRQRPRQV